ncbi:MAG: AAA family ATPase [Coprobacillus sp.]|nr:AAA family ATPase [Coprobacillus sp.]
MNKLLVLAGVPGSGKSYFASLIRNAKGGHVYTVSSDNLRDLIGGSIQYFGSESLVWEMFYDLPKGYSHDKDGIVILDATQGQRRFRDECTKDLKNYFDEFILVIFEVPQELSDYQNKHRQWVVPDNVMEDFRKEFEHPDKVEEEYFDHVYYIHGPEDFDPIAKKVLAD